MKFNIVCCCCFFSSATDDALVKAAINGIPKEASNRGVFPETALRERFLKVKKGLLFFI